ncbi:hypothetical protein SUGI_1096960 [Cryptomeria japonica]|nr:hypothetical protein SUGI_1096960 [Cryptomeria japonica]
MKLRDAENEILHLRESLSQSIKKTKQVEDERDSNKRSFSEKGRENSELQKSVLRLQQLCINQQKRIDGLEGSLSSSKQKEKELMVLVGGQENSIRRLQADLQECLKSMMLLRR